MSYTHTLVVSTPKIAKIHPIPAKRPEFPQKNSQLYQKFTIPSNFSKNLPEIFPHPLGPRGNPWGLPGLSWPRPPRPAPPAAPRARAAAWCGSGARWSWSWPRRLGMAGKIHGENHWNFMWWKNFVEEWWFLLVRYVLKYHIRWNLKTFFPIGPLFIGDICVEICFF